MEYPLLIPDIARKIERVIKKLRLKPHISPQKFIEKTEGKKHRYSSICLDERSRKLLFYARLHQSSYQKERMTTEVKLAKVFINPPFFCRERSCAGPRGRMFGYSKEGRIKKPIFRWFPCYFQAGITKDFEWLTREYFPSLPVEKKKEIERLKKPLKEEMVLKIIEALMEMQNLPLRLFPFLKKFEISKYANLIGIGHLLLKEKVIDGQALQSLKELVRKNIKLLEKENNYFCHGDFQIGNLLIFNHRLKIIDLESAHLNNFAFDIAFFTSRLWQHPGLRKRMIEKYFELLPAEKKAVFPALFRLDAFFIGYHTFRSRPREYTLKKLQQREDFYKKFLRATLKNLPALLSETFTKKT